MKVGDKVICIEDYNDSGWLPKNYSVTKGQVYEVSYCERSGIHYKINKINVKGKGNVNYPIEIFITLEQWRDNQLNNIGI